MGRRATAKKKKCTKAQADHYLLYRQYKNLPFSLESSYYELVLLSHLLIYRNIRVFILEFRFTEIQQIDMPPSKRSVTSVRVNAKTTAA